MIEDKKFFFVFLSFSLAVLAILLLISCLSYSNISIILITRDTEEMPFVMSLHSV